jgi:hypothetical protein
MQRWYLVNNRLFLGMGYKIVCLICRKAFSTGPDYLKPEKCSECGNDYIFYNHKFRPPKKDDIRAWTVVGFLYENGFTYQHVYKDLTIYRWASSENQAEYPQSLEEAKDFVLKYKSQSIKEVK